MTGKTAFIFLLTATTVFAVPGAPGQARELVTIFFTGNELGSMRPCGCSGGQLGGLDRRYAVFNTINPQNRFIIDTGSLVPESTEQNRIKFNIIVQAFAQLGYDVVNLTEQDILIARQEGLLDGLGSLFKCITAGSPDDVKLPAKFTKEFTLNGIVFEAAVVAAETEDQIFRLPDLFSSTAAGSSSAVKNLILNRFGNASL
jgi:hypothetical protein